MTDLLTRAASFEPTTFDAKTNTVDVTFTTGSDAPRNDFEGPFLERLEVSATAMDLTQLKGGPVLDNHDRVSGVRTILGIVEEARVDGTRGVARLRFSSRPEVQGVIDDVKSGIIRNVSVGYQVKQWQISKRADGMRIKTATSWKPIEISFTPLGADPGAIVRTKENLPMNPQDQIRNMGAAVGIEATFTDALISRNATVEESRTAIIQEAARTIPTIINRAPGQVTSNTTVENLTRASVEVLFNRMNPSYKLEDPLAKQYANASFCDLSRTLLHLRSAQSAIGGASQIIDRSLMTTSDLPNIVGELINKSLLPQYAAAPRGILDVFKRGTFVDFRPQNKVRLSESEQFDTVNEAGEFKRGSLSDGKEVIKGKTVGKIIGIARQVFVNDDLSALGTIVASLRLNKDETEAQAAATCLHSNPILLTDSKAVFHTAHANIQSTAGTIGSTTLTEARLAMRKQKGLGGKIAINATPKFLLVPAALETVAEQYLAQIYAATSGNVNPFAGKLELLVDPRLDAFSATQWYVFADPAILPCFEFSYLAGQEGLYVETRSGFEVDSIEVKARLDYAVGALDFRGAFRNAGA